MAQSLVKSKKFTTLLKISVVGLLLAFLLPLLRSIYVLFSKAAEGLTLVDNSEKSEDNFNRLLSKETSGTKLSLAEANYKADLIEGALSSASMSAIHGYDWKKLWAILEPMSNADFAFVIKSFGVRPYFHGIPVIMFGGNAENIPNMFTGEGNLVQWLEEELWDNIFMPKHLQLVKNHFEGLSIWK